MEFKIRPLITRDMFKASKLLKKLDINLDFKGKEQEQIGGELLLSVIENLHLAEAEAGEFFGGLVGLTAEQFNELPIEDSISIIKQLKDVPGINSFFKSAGQSMQK